MEEKLTQAFEALKTYDWGDDRKKVQPILDAVVTTYGDAEARKELETALIEALKAGLGRDSTDVVCRQLKTIGTDACVPTLAAMLGDEEDSHMARYALERIEAPQAAAALRDAMGKLKGELLAGVIGSLGVREDKESTAALAKLVTDSDQMIADAAAVALGNIGTAEAADALAKAKVTVWSTDASLICAEKLLDAGNKNAAKAVYMRFAVGDHPKHVRLAATAGMLACTR